MTTPRNAARRIPQLTPFSRGWQRRCGCLVLGTALAVVFSFPAAAQSGPVHEPAGGGAGSTAPTREGDIYGHVKHRPTEAEVGAAEGAAGIDAPAPATDDQIDESVEELLQQTDELDKVGKEIAPDVSPPAPAGGGSEPR